LMRRAPVFSALALIGIDREMRSHALPLTALACFNLRWTVRSEPRKKPRALSDVLRI